MDKEWVDKPFKIILQNVGIDKKLLGNAQV